MDRLSAPQQNAIGAYFANLLRKVEQDSGPEFLPRGLDVMGLVRQLALPSAETVEKLSYGDPLFRMPQQSNIPITTDRGYVAEVLGMAPAVPAASRATTRISNEVADQLVKAITRNPDATAVRALDEIGRMSPVPQITTYHGSPYLFRELDPSKVGTGEGAQAYGYGAGYTAQVRDVAESYTPRDYEYENALMDLYKKAERRQDYGSMEVLESAMMHKRPAELREQFGPEAEDIINSIAGLENRSYLYKGEIPDKILPKFLDWDLEISQQSKEVQELAKKLGLEPDDFGGDLVAKVGKDAAGTKIMEEAGIKGIKYYDANSRNAQFGSQNYIPFSPEDYEIEEINDIPISEYLNQGLL
jgi:hypothetical protein